MFEHLFLPKIEARCVAGLFSLALPVGHGENFILSHLVPCPPKHLRLFTLSPNYQY